MLSKALLNSKTREILYAYNCDFFAIQYLILGKSEEVGGIYQNVDQRYKRNSSDQRKRHSSKRHILATVNKQNLVGFLISGVP